MIKVSLLNECGGLIQLTKVSSSFDEQPFLLDPHEAERTAAEILKVAKKIKKMKEKNREKP